MSETKQKGERPYHHGNLRAELLKAAVEVIEEQGVAELKLRELARRAGVSHAAPANHFKDRNGLLVALALEGFEKLRAMQTAAIERSGGSITETLNALGVSYVEFATRNRAHFAVMFQRDLLLSSEQLANVAAKNYELLMRSVQPQLAARPRSESANCVEGRLLALGAWALVHGLATLQNQGLLPADPDTGLEVARQIITVMQGGDPTAGKP